MEDINTELNIYSEEVKDVLSDPPKLIFRFGNVLLLAFIGVILITSYLIKYPDIVTSQAFLTTDIPPQKEYARVTGKIDSLFVSNFQEVNENTTLGIIENTANYSDVILLKSIIDTIKIGKDSFYFPIEELPMLFLGEIEDEFSIFENNYTQYILNKKSQSYLNTKIANTYSLSQLRFRLNTLINQKNLNTQELKFKKKELTRTKNLFDKGIISAQEYETKELEYLQAERNYENLNVSISQVKENISNASTEKKQLKIDNTREEINYLKSVIQSFYQLKNAIKQWELTYVFKSKISGKVSFMKVWNKNQSVNAGDFIFTIIPKKYSTYICKVQAQALNSGKIRVGQNVNIKLSNYPDNEFGILKGKVKEISLVPNNEGNYIIDVSIPEKLVTTHNHQIDFKQEMQGVAEIITEDLRLIDRIFYQFKDVFK